MCMHVVCVLHQWIQRFPGWVSGIAAQLRAQSTTVKISSQQSLSQFIKLRTINSWEAEWQNVVSSSKVKAWKRVFSISLKIVDNICDSTPHSYRRRDRGQAISAREVRILFMDLISLFIYKNVHIAYNFNHWVI